MLGLVREKETSIRLKLVRGLLLFAVATAIAVFLLRQPQYYDPLDYRLHSDAWRPTKLLDVLSWKYQPNGESPLHLNEREFYAIQHQALLRLLDLQPNQFHKAVPVPTSGGTLIDHAYARIDASGPDGIVVIGTGTLKSFQVDDTLHGHEPYWQIERFVFASNGALISRQPFTLTTDTHSNATNERR
jgi:hypothetical protein